MIRFLSAGESHGQALTAIIEGFPAGVPVDRGKIDEDLRQRQGGYGRGGRQRIEHDQVEILSGVRGGVSLGSPITLMIRNRDWDNWQGTMAVEGPVEGGELTRVRPGHADLAGALKYGQVDARNILERASARETAVRVAVGSLCELFLEQLGIELFSHVLEIGGRGWKGYDFDEPRNFDWERAKAKILTSQVRCLDERAERDMITAIDAAREAGDTLGGVFQVLVKGLPVGLGSHVHWDRRLEARLSAALMSINAVKAVQVGLGMESARRPGSQVHDEIVVQEGVLRRPTNRAGGLEGGITNGELLALQAAMKPIATLKKPLRSVDLKTMEPVSAQYERSDVCAVPAASVIGKAMVAVVLAQAAQEKFGGDSLREVRANMEAFLESTRTLLSGGSGT